MDNFLAIADIELPGAEPSSAILSLKAADSLKPMVIVESEHFWALFCDFLCFMLQLKLSLGCIHEVSFSCPLARRLTNAKREQFLEKVVYLHRQGFSISEIVRTVKCLSKSTVYAWLKEEDSRSGSKGKAMKHQAITNASERKCSAKDTVPTTPEEEMTREELLAELRRLKAQLRDSRVLNLLQGKMMEIAEREYGIHFRKKPGAKPSAK